MAEDGYGLGGLADLRGRYFGAGLGYAAEATTWAWLDLARGRLRAALYHRRPLGQGRLLLAARLYPAGSAVGLAGYYGEARRRGAERLWLWAGVDLRHRPAANALALTGGARWRAPVFGGPIEADLEAQTQLALAAPDPPEALGLGLDPLALRAGWVYRFDGGELRLGPLRLHLAAVGGRRRLEFAVLAAGWIALR